jgi:hypothetical protein
MIKPASLQLVEAEAAEAQAEVAAVEPRVFARSISAPAGWPWEQARAAALEARHSEPLPGGEVAHQVRRLEAWRPGQPARFAAFYVRRGEIGDRLEAEALLAGERHRVVFVSAAQERRRTRLVASVGVGAGLTVFAAVAGAGVARKTGEAAEARLATLEAGARADLRKAQTLNRQRRLAAAIEDRDRGPGFDAPLSDLAWSARAKRPEARILAWHWEPGLSAVESRGKESPFVVADRPVQRSGAPVRRGVWLWGVGAAAETAQPVAAEPRR